VTAFVRVVAKATIETTVVVVIAIALVAAFVARFASAPKDIARIASRSLYWEFYYHLVSYAVMFYLDSTVKVLG